jgi:hypothetical protein
MRFNYFYSVSATVITVIRKLTLSCKRYLKAYSTRDFGIEPELAKFLVS